MPLFLDRKYNRCYNFICYWILHLQYFARYVASITGVLLYNIKCLIFVLPVDIVCGAKAKLHLVSFKSKHHAFFLLSFYLFPAVITYTIYDICIIAVTAAFFTFKHSLLPSLSVISHYFCYVIKKKHHM